MFEYRKARNAFEDCPNRKIIAAENSTTGMPSSNRYNFRCAKYPEGIGREITKAELTDRSNVTEFSIISTAQTLGCVACPYKNTPHQEVRTETVTIDGSLITEIRMEPMQPVDRTE